jgi:ATP phosphoribosyltransferase regulatory subunit
MTPPLATAPLPSGVWQLGPEAARLVFDIQAKLLGVLAGKGYQRVLTPTLEAGQSAAGPGFRVLDPESGGLLALRSDITPQVARLVATQLGPPAPGAGPHRLSYSGRVFRPETRHGLAAREIHQTGAELIGASGTQADREVLELAAACLVALHLPEPVLVLGHGGLLRGLVAGLADDLPGFDAGAFRRAAERRDLSAARRLTEGHPIAGLVDAVWLGIGDRALLSDLTARLGEIGLQPCLAAARELERVLTIGERLRDGVGVKVDLLAERGSAYYTGVSFVGLCRGASRPLLTGGRYDDLLTGYGCPLPAGGFAVDDEAVLAIVAGLG